MKDKIACICVSIIIMTVFMSNIVIANEIRQPFDKIDINDLTSRKFCINGNVTEISTVGPISPIFGILITEISFIEGPFFKVKLIEEILGNIMLHFIFPNISINVEDLTFMVKYTRNIPELPVIKRFFYSTTIMDNGNETLFNTKHTIIVTGFDGQFGLYRTKPLRLYTAHFWFKGSCDEVIILT